MAKYNLIGGKSKGKTLAEIAQLHGMTEKELKPQFQKGTKHELEHTNNVIVARQIALDHLVEFPDYYDRLDKIEKMKKGAVVETPATLNDIVLYYERKGNWLFAKGNFYAWLYDDKDAGKKIESEEYDYIMFPRMGKGSPFSEKYVPPLLMVWDKSYQKKLKGSEHLLGIVQGFYDEDKNQLIIDMMTSNPKFRRKGINAHIIKQLRTEFGVSQDDVIFDKPTKEGKLFESSKKYHLGGDMSKHLAPNGKPSNLTHEQWHLIRTPEFKAWFGDWENDPKNASKVVDDNGEPLVVYHGTMVETTFNVFDYDKADLGFHFGTSEQAKNRVESKSILPSRKSIVNSFFLNIRVLFEMSDAGEWQYPQRYIDELTSDNIIEEKIAKQKGFFSLYEREDNALIRDYIKSKYGSAVGFVYNNKYEGKGKSFIALSTNQIKLADGTNTKFDGNNSDIRFNKGGLIAPNGNQSNLTPEQYKLVRTKAFKDWFGDWENDPNNSSKVVDENGEPLVLFHNTDKVINIFRVKGKIKTLANDIDNYGVYFSKKNEYVSFKGNKIYACFLRILNPYIVQDQFWSAIITQEKYQFILENHFDGVILNRFGNDFYSETIVFSSNQIKLADGTNTTFDGNNPDIRFANGGEIDETAQMYIDIISMNPNLEKYQKYKDILKREYDIDFDSIYKDNEYIENANLQDIKSQSDFLDFDNWLKYAKKISMMRGFVRMDDYMMAFKYDVTDDVWKKMSALLDFRIEKVEYIETTGSGDIARVMGNTIYYTEHADLYYLLHEIGHIYDFQNNVNGIIHNPAYSPTHYGTMNGGETFAENFAIYFINPTALKNWNEEVYDEMEKTINAKYEVELTSLVSEYLSDGIRFGKGGTLDFSSSKSLSIKIDNDIYKIQYQKDELGSESNPSEKKVWFAKVISKNGKQVEGRLCYADDYVAVIYGFNLDEIKDGIMYYYQSNDLYLILQDESGKVIETTHIENDNPDIRFANGGLIAPNGKESNLTPEQYKLVRTKAFKDWFGDWENDPKNASKVVDENGEPLVVYRGSKSKNPNYIPHKHELSNGIYFSTKKEVAELYTTSVWQNWVGRVFECFLNIRNLDEYDTLQLKSNIYQADFDYYNKIVTTSYENKFDGIRWDNFIDVPDLQNIFPKEPIDFIATTFIVFEPTQIKLADGTNTTFDGNNPDIRYKRGGRTIAQTPAPKSDRVYGSKTNPKGSASDSELAKSIKFNDNLEKAIENKVIKYNDEHPMDKVRIQTAKAVVRRGMGAYSKSHRPTISGGAPNSRQAWGLARLNKFLLKNSGVKVKSAYIQDDDLLEK
jgi:hypothetical protein